MILFKVEERGRFRASIYFGGLELFISSLYLQKCIARGSLIPAYI